MYSLSNVKTGGSWDFKIYHRDIHSELWRAREILNLGFSRSKSVNDNLSKNYRFTNEELSKTTVNESWRHTKRALVVVVDKWFWSIKCVSMALATSF